jgi:Magnesium chelatase, subunit ChlI
MLPGSLIIRIGTVLLCLRGEADPPPRPSAGLYSVPVGQGLRHSCSRCGGEGWSPAMAVDTLSGEDEAENPASALTIMSSWVPPGAGTSRLVRRLTTHLPAMTLAGALDTTRLPRVAGLTGDCTALVTTRPFRTPHHTISDVGLIGGGQVPQPRDVSLAHHGVRLRDERPARPTVIRAGCAT